MTDPKNSIFEPKVAEGSLWLLIPKAAGSISASVILFLGLFWLRFGEIAMFAVGFSIFLAVLQILIVVGIRFRNAANLDIKPRNDVLDKVGGWWLIACAFGAFAAYVLQNLADSFVGLAVAMHVAAVILAIVLPLLTALPNIRYVDRRVAHVQIPLLFLVTLLPMFVGIASLVFLWKSIGVVSLSN